MKLSSPRRVKAFSVRGQACRRQAERNQAAGDMERVPACRSAAPAPGLTGSEQQPGSGRAEGA